MDEELKTRKLTCKGCGLVLAQWRDLRHEKIKAEVINDFTQNTNKEGFDAGVAFAHCTACGHATPFLLDAARMLGPVPVKD